MKEIKLNLNLKKIKKFAKNRKKRKYIRKSG